ncbi:MAG TPA: hypothetical protein VGV14_19000 [Rhodanobacter sp.]|nr:hypothetical protein [Rhodanobacter sp.]
MNQPYAHDVVGRTVRDVHATQASAAFFNAWRHGATLAGPELFGDGTFDGPERARSKMDLRPNMLLLGDAIDRMSPARQIFLAAMISLYSAREGGALFRRIGFEGLAHLGRLDLERREVIATLIHYYDPW